MERVRPDSQRCSKRIEEADGSEGPGLLVFGSGLFLQTLLANHLVDVLHIWTFPITLGVGQKLFQEGVPAQQWKLTESTTSSTGAIFATFIPDGKVKTDK